MGPPVIGLITLPEELLLAILDQIDPEDHRAIRSLNTTCRLLYRLTIDRLYRRFPGPYPQLFLRTIVLPPPDGNPAFASYVKKVVWHQYYWLRKSRLQDLSRRYRYFIADKLRSSGCILNTMDVSMDLPTRFIGFSSEYEVHWWFLEFFLFFTPEVEELFVDDVWQWDDHSYWFESLAANPSHFENLKSITIRGPLRLENIVPLLTLPSLRIIDLSEAINTRQEPGRTFQWTEGRDDFLTGRLAHGSCLERLTLRESDLNFPSVKTIFATLRKLKYFTYEHVPNHLTAARVLPTLPTDACSTLTEVQHGNNNPLEHLRLRNDCKLAAGEVLSLFFCKAAPSADPELALGKLRTLDIGPCDLLSFRGTGNAELNDKQILAGLPRTLETLRIQWAYQADWQRQLPDFLNLLLGLAQTAVSSGANLKKIAIVEWPALAGWFPLPDEVSNLELAVTEMGMHFDVLYEEVKGEGPLEEIEDFYDDWLWVNKTSSFASHADILSN